VDTKSPLPAHVVDVRTESRGFDRARRTPPHVVSLTQDEKEVVDWLASGLLERFETVEHPQFLSAVAVTAHELPRRLRSELVAHRTREDNGALLFTGMTVDDERIGPTPVAVRQLSSQSTIREDTWFLLFASLLGDPFGWSFYRNGSLLHDLCPDPAAEGMQSGNGWGNELQWHVEEAYHAYWPDHLGLMCLRNPQSTATTIAQMADVNLPAHHAEILRRPLYSVRADDGSSASAGAGRAIDGVKDVPVLFGADDSPYVRVDPGFMVTPEDPNARDALECLYAEVTAKLQSIVLQPGEMLFLDNRRVVHGREVLHARFDGRDRWLRRVWTTSDIRKSRHRRSSAHDRAIH
jgi:Fe(II)/alpha-ketoglutarate-dependent arginine beta-hydroxylase